MSEPGRIDVHFHIIPPFYKEAVYAAGGGPAVGRYPEWNPELALEIIDENGIETAITSVAQPGVQFAPAGEARILARKCNEYAAELVAKYPARFGAFTLVPMHSIEDAVEEINYCYDNLQFEGVCLFASYGEKFLGDPSLDPLLELLNEREAVVFIHPTYHPSSKSLELPWPGFMIEYLFDTTRAAVNLLFTGALEKFPKIRFILAHAGGTIPYISWRLSVSPMIDPRLPQLSQSEVLEGLGKFWFDTALSSGPPTWGALSQVAKPTQIVFGSDWPFANAKVVHEELEGFTQPGSVPRELHPGIMRNNAKRLFPGR